MKEILTLNALRYGFSKDSGFVPERELELCLKLGVDVLTPDSADYPALLASIPDPPRVLYVKGSLRSARTLAMVGSRRPTPYGRRVSRSLAAEAAQAGIVTVSGLARGIDTEVHQSTLESGGKTWAVLGCGLQTCYPPENRRWMDDILEREGAVISEVPLSGPPFAGNFPKRNRIISGLSWGTVVVEGDLRSGSLITARCALDQGRAVFAVPGPIDSPMSEGPNELIRNGACPVRGLQDVLNEIAPLKIRTAPGYPLPERERDGVRVENGIFPSPSSAHSFPTIDGQKVLQLIGSEIVAVEDMLRETGWSVERLTRILMELELQGRVEAAPGQRYARR